MPPKDGEEAMVIPVGAAGSISGLPIGAPIAGPAWAIYM